MRKFWAAALGASMAFGLTTAAYSDSPVAATFGNTVLVTNAKNETNKIWFKDDGTFTSKSFDNKDGMGTWALTDGDKKICLTAKLPEGVKPPEGGIKPACSDFVGAKKAGDKWTQKDANNEDVTVEIKAGM